MKTVDIHAAQKELSHLVDEAVGGEEVVIAREGKPVARLVPVQPVKKRRQLGTLEGKLNTSDDFDAPLPDDLIALFEGR